METTNNSSEILTITGNWELQSRALKSQFPELTDSDLTFEDGHESAMVTKIVTRLNKKREEVIELIKSGMISEN